MHAVLLAGDHPTLPLAELEAILAVHGGRIHDAPTTRVRRFIGNIEHMVGALGWGEYWGDVACDEAGIDEATALVAKHVDGVGTAAVLSRRYGDDKSNLSNVAERRIGKALSVAGHPIQLSSPDVAVFAWLGEGRIIIGRLAKQRPRDHEARISERRAHFSPVSMHPRRAAGLVHLARVPPGGRLLDPFCGTGGIALEAALLGYAVVASDLDLSMVQGTLQTLADVGPEPLEATVFLADISDVPNLVDGVDGIVTDLPYGGASSTHDEAIASLYARALETFAELLQPGARAVVGHAQPELLESAPDFGLNMVESHAEFVHKSLTRHYAVFERIAADSP